MRNALRNAGDIAEERGGGSAKSLIKKRKGTIIVGRYALVCRAAEIWTRTPTLARSNTEIDSWPKCYCIKLNNKLIFPWIIHTKAYFICAIG